MAKSIRRPVSSGQRGFSLVEAMVVLVIFGIVLAVSAPNIMESNRRRRAEAAANEFAGKALVARQKTIATRVPFRLVMDQEARACWTERAADDSTWTIDPPDTVRFAPDLGLEFTAGGSSENTEVEFRGDGTMIAEDAPLLLTTSSCETDSFTVSMVRTGRLVVRRGGP
jgi:type II secretion system protein H